MMLSFLLADCSADLSPIAFDPPSLPTAYQAGSERSITPQRDLRDWWQAFNDPTLTRLVARASEQNLTIQQAKLRFAAGRAQADAAHTVFRPSAGMGGQALAGTQRSVSDDPFRKPLQAGFDMSWDVGLFGLQESASRAAEASTAIFAEDAEAIRVVVTAEVASTYMRLRAAQQRSSVLSALLALRERAHRLADTRQRSGLASSAEINEAQIAFADARAEGERLSAQIGQLQQQIATLLGTASIDPALRETGVQSTPRGAPSVGRPLDLLRARPDVRSAEQRVLRAAAEIGIAQADLYPKLRLVGTIGVGAPSSGSLFGVTGGPSLQLPLFDYGRRQATLTARHALLDEALAAYRQTVLLAYEEASSALRTWAAEHANAARLRAVQVASGNIDRQAQVLRREGLADQAKADVAASLALARRKQLIDAQEAEAVALIAVYKAIGGAAPLPPTIAGRRLDRR
ncbi:TolC family protein [Boseaceae bacterium BT-24-1]|nr:TolC family protein [Boseaceae bacterium BT-24-1]